jgi:hypothetical protein
VRARERLVRTCQTALASAHTQELVLCCVVLRDGTLASHASRLARTHGPPRAAFQHVPFRPLASLPAAAALPSPDPSAERAVLDAVNLRRLLTGYREPLRKLRVADLKARGAKRLVCHCRGSPAMAVAVGLCADVRRLQWCAAFVIGSDLT